MKNKLGRLVGRTVRAVVIAVAVVMVPPAIYGLQEPGSYADQMALDAAVAVLRDADRCQGHKSPELDRAIKYTLGRYHCIGRLHVTVHRLPPSVWGINIPWTPGITVNSDKWGECPEMDAILLLHEAMHDLPPYFGHSHITPVQEEFISWVLSQSAC